MHDDAKRVIFAESKKNGQESNLELERNVMTFDKASKLHGVLKRPSLLICLELEHVVNMHRNACDINNDLQNALGLLAGLVKQHFQETSN